MFRLRGSQQSIYDYTRGRMGVVAVPGSGKTFTLSMLAAKLVCGDFLDDDQEVLIVTLTNSAVNNFKQRISARLTELGFPPGLRYRVRTLHGLANDLVHNHLSLAGLSNQFVIWDERERERALEGITREWLATHPEFRARWQPPEAGTVADGETHSRPDLSRQVKDIGSNFIRQAKDLGLAPEDIRRKLAALRESVPLVEMGCWFYEEYQRSLSYAYALDFDDLLLKALKVLQSDPELLASVRHTWPYILEDEAQDSNEMQERIIRMLVGEDGNWVRVGDPNQAIYSTFTTASPRFLRDFLREPGVTARTLPTSGRSTRSIIALANTLVNWTRNDHPVAELREALDLPEIRPVDDPADEQPNPEDDPAGILLLDRKYTTQEELNVIGRSLERWLPGHTDWTVAVLVPSNHLGANVVSELQKRRIPYLELLRSTTGTRQVAEQLWAVLNYLAAPVDPRNLRSIYTILRLQNDEDNKIFVQADALLEQCKNVEEYLQVRPGDGGWLAGLPAEVPAEVREELEQFAVQVRRWQAAAVLPVDQLLLTVAQDLFSQPQDLAVAHRLALLMEYYERTHPEATLRNHVDELNLIVRNQRKLRGFEGDDAGFNPELHRGKVIVTTVHKAKGLEWDRVYLMSVNNYDFPSAQPYDSYVSEIPTPLGSLDLSAETLARLKALAAADIPALYLPYGEATQQARLDHCAERLRLLYVGITRAKRELLITYNAGKKSGIRAALPFIALHKMRQEEQPA